MNVLLTCAGRRNYLLRYLKAALAGDGRVFAADTSADAPALQEADKAFLVPPVDDPDAMDTILAICKDHEVKVVFSLNDFELPFLADHRDRFLSAGVSPVVSTREVIDICFDKWATLTFLRSCGLPVPCTYLTVADARKALASGQLEFPLIVKPRWGTASIGIEVVSGDAELHLVDQLVRSKVRKSSLAAAGTRDTEHVVLIQEMLPGAEHGMDVVNDLSGNYAATLVRHKIGMRAGETDRAVTVNDDRFDALGELLGSRLHHIGNLDCDVFADADGQLTVLEMNPRFGGGYPFSHVAGANVPAAVLAWARGAVPERAWLRQQAGVKSAKYDDIVVTGGCGN